MGSDPGLEIKSRIGIRELNQGIGQKNSNFKLNEMSNAVICREKNQIIAESDGSLYLGDAQAFQEFIKNYKKKSPDLQYNIAIQLLSIAKENNGMSEKDYKIMLRTEDRTVLFDMKNYKKIQWCKNKDINFAEFLRNGSLRWIHRLADVAINIGKGPLSEAQNFLGDYYTNGYYGKDSKLRKGFKYYLQAFKQGNVKATFRVGYSYEHGIGVKKDPKRSVQYYKRAAFAGDLLAIHRLAIALQDGQLGLKKSLKESFTWLKRAASEATKEYPKPIHDLALCYEKDGSPATIPDEGYAYQLFKRAALFGYPPSQYKLGLCSEYGLLGQKIDYHTAISWYFRAAKNNEFNAELAISSWYLSGKNGILEKSEKEALNWAMRASSSGSSKADFALGYYYENGIGCKPCIDTAINYYRKAAKKGNRRAKIRAKELRRIHGKAFKFCIF